jgi:aminoglycoside phosphotransferase (APT) family kinase protein
MAEPIDPKFAAWAVDSLEPGGSLVSARGLREGGAPWLLSVRGADGAAEAEAVLRVGPLGEPDDIRVEAASLRFAGENNLLAPKVLAMRDDSDPALLLIERVQGSSDIPLVRSSARLRRLGAFAARMASLDPPADFVRRTRGIAGEDFAALRREAAPQPLLQRAESIVSSHTPTARDGFVHGDMWQGNSMWVGDKLVAVIDWDCSGRGPAGIDLGSLRLDAAMCFGAGAEHDVLEGWKSVAGPAFDVPYWDLVAALSTPPEIDWFVDSTRAQGRPDLTQDIMRERRDHFLENALRANG